MENLPLGFRFKPTDEEAVNYYLGNKNRGNDEAVAAIAEIGVFKREPSELPGLSAIKTRDPEWYFFCPVDGNYPNGQRLGRSTVSGYWKSTGRDRQIKSGNGLIGMKKTLVFHRGHGNTAERTNWVMHEYRATGPAPAPVQSRFVLCRVFEKQHKPANSEPEPELTQGSQTPILDTANMLPHVDGQSSGCAPVSETNQVTNLFEVEELPQDRNFGPMPSPMSDPYHWLYVLREMSHNVGESQDELEAGNPSLNVDDEFCDQRDSTTVEENGSGEGSQARPYGESTEACFTLSSGSTAGQFHDGHDKLHNDTDAQTDPQTEQGYVKQGKARRRLRLRTKRRVRPVTMESGDESSMPEDHESKSIDKEGLKAEEKEIAVVGHSAAIAVSELKQSSPLEPSSNSEELIANDRADRKSETTILTEGETTKASRDRFSFWLCADIFRVAAVVVMFSILVISTLRSLYL